MPLKLPLADDGVFDQFCIGELAVKFGTFQVRTRENFDINVPVTPNPCTSGGGFEYNAVLVWQDGEDAIVWATPSSGSNTSYFCASTGGPISAVLNLEVDGGAGKFRCATGSLTIETDFSALVPDELEPLGIPGMLLYSPSPRSSELSPTVIRGVVDVPIQC